jgi:hypothetical protein
VAVAVTSLLFRRASFDGLFYGGAICWGAMSVALLIFLPGGTYMALVPAIALGFCALLRAIVDLDATIIAITGCIVSGVLLLPMTTSFYEALGRPVLPALALVVALVTTTFAACLVSSAPDGSAPAPRLPFLSKAAVALAAVLTLFALSLPPYTHDSPRRLSLSYVDDNGNLSWQADALTPALRKAAKFGSGPQSSAPWSRFPGHPYSAPAPALDAALPPVEVNVVRDEKSGPLRLLTLALHSPRGAPRVALFFHAPTLASLKINGVTPPPPTVRHRNFLADGWHRVAVRGASDATIELTVRDAGPIEGVAIDTSYGLPAAGAPLTAARNASAAVPSDDGDVTSTRRRVRF